MILNINKIKFKIKEASERVEQIKILKKIFMIITMDKIRKKGKKEFRITIKVKKNQK